MDDSDQPFINHIEILDQYVEEPELEYIFTYLIIIHIIYNYLNGNGEIH